VSADLGTEQQRQYQTLCAGHEDLKCSRALKLQSPVSFGLIEVVSVRLRDLAAEYAGS
jgi:hypothetical protein